MKDSKILPKIILRDKLFFTTSQEILTDIKDKLDKAFQYLIKDVREITWDSIELVEGTINFVYVKGTFTPKIGDIITYPDGSKDTITKELLDKPYRNYIRIMIPLKVLENEDAEGIHASMKAFNQLNSLLSQEELIDLINEIKCSDFNQLLENNTILDKITRPREIGFHTRDLTEQQVVQLAIFINAENNWGQA